VNTAGLQDPFGLAGTLLENQYRADAVVGEGGFGVVYRGRHLSLDQPIAIKVLKGLDGGDPRINALVLEKFRAEARLLYTLSQSSLHIVRALDFGATTMPSGAWAPFMILEWLEGRSLADDLVERRNRGMRGRSIAETFAILEPAADGLAVAHRQQVAHRDVKPANIFLLDSGGKQAGPHVKVLDFGIAKIMKEGESAGTKGTFASFTWLYATPEQLDPRLGLTGLATDVYAFGLLITELMTDRKPVDDRDVVGIMKAATNPNRRPTPRTRGANIPDELEAICQRALAVDPKQRFASIPEMWAALVAVRDGRGSTTQQQPASVHLQQGVPSSGRSAPATTPQGPPASVAALANTNLASPHVTPRRAQHATALPMSIPRSVQQPPSMQQPQPAQPPQQQHGVPLSAQMTSPPAGARAPGFAPPPGSQGAQPGMHPVALTGPLGPPPGTAAPGYHGAMPGYPTQGPYPASPPPGTPPPGQAIRLPFVRADGTSPVVVVTIVFFVLAILLAGSCAVVHGACNAAT
jgi:serine/threonine-protein kinase